MNGTRFGECLGQVVNLSEHDVAEILEDQSSSHRRFGEIAMAWGLCRPEDVWHAWCHQLARLTPEVNLATIGIDSQAIAHLPASLAREFGVVPIRSFGGQLVVATDALGAARAAQELPRLLPASIKFVVASRESIAAAIERYYSVPAVNRSIAS